MTAKVFHLQLEHKPTILNRGRYLVCPQCFGSSFAVIVYQRGDTEEYILLCENKDCGLEAPLRG